jgi:probable HAF family extracellular repeat protein
MRDLGPAGRNSRALAINNRGQVVGGWWTSGSQVMHAFRWTPTGGFQELDSFGGRTIALAINNGGQVTGYATFGQYLVHAYRWTPRGGMRDLGTLGGGGSDGNAINEWGWVAGDALTASGELHAAVWR